MNKQTKQIVLYAAIAAAAVASVTTVIILAVHHKKKKKLAEAEPDLLDAETEAEKVEEAEVA